MSDPSAFAAMVSGSTNGTPLAGKPYGAIGVRIYLVSTASVSYAVGSSQPASAPTAFTVSQAAIGAYYWDERLGSGDNLYVTAASGTSYYRWIVGG